jgi:membrane protein
MAWIADGGPSLGASIAFYTIFALAPLLLITLAIAGFFFGDEAATGQLFEEIRGLVGDNAAENLQELVRSANRRAAQGIMSAIVSVVTALIGASAVFVELKRGFDAIFHPPAKEASAVTIFVRARLMAVALALAFGFLVVVSLILSAAAAAFGKWLSVTAPILAPVMSVLDIFISTGVLTLAFWMLIRFLPDVPPRPAAIWIGALTSAVLFAVGKHLIGLYLARGAVASAYGAAGSFIVVILWVYYSAQILLLGAEVARSIDDPGLASRKAEAGRETVAAASVAP